MAGALNEFNSEIQSACRVYDNFAQAAWVNKLKSMRIPCLMRMKNFSCTNFVTYFATSIWPSTMKCGECGQKAVHFNNSFLQIVLIGIRCWIWLRYRVSLFAITSSPALVLIYNRNASFLNASRRGRRGIACRFHAVCVKHVNSFRVNECVWFGPPLAETYKWKKEKKEIGMAIWHFDSNHN